MSAVKSRDTSPEMYVRRALHAQGFRYRLHAKHLPGRPDLTFPRLKTMIFVNGCFWHSHGCPRSRLPKTRVAYWRKKFKGNVQRDRRTHQLLRAEGWTIIVIWQCELEIGVRTASSHLESMRELRQLRQTRLEISHVAHGFGDDRAESRAQSTPAYIRVQPNANMVARLVKEA